MAAVIQTQYGEFKVRKSINPAWGSYDKTVAKTHLSNYGVIFTDSYGSPIDDEYTIQEVYQKYKQGNTDRPLTAAQKAKCKKFLSLYSKQYKMLYDNNVDTSKYSNYFAQFDAFCKNHPNILREIVKLRGDFFTSDREVVAFMLALRDLK